MSELSDWKRLVLPGLIADAEARGRGESADELASLRTRLAEALTENERLRGALKWFEQHGDGLESDVRSAHQNRGNGPSQWMIEDDREFRSALSDALSKVRAALAQTKEPEHG